MIAGCAPRYFLSQTVPGVFAHSIYGAARKEASVTEEQGVEFVRERKYHMEVRGANDFRPALVHPEFFADSLTDGTVPVTAGILVESMCPHSLHSLTLIPSLPPTCRRGWHGKLFSVLGLEMSGLTVIRIGILPDVRILKLLMEHPSHLFKRAGSGRKSLGRQRT